MSTLTLGIIILAAATPLPTGSAPDPVSFPHFPDATHAFVWRNWQTVPVARMAETISAKPDDILRMGKAMGLPDPPTVTPEDMNRLSTTIIKHNWHLLPYEQLMKLLDWTPEMMAYHLREDDFLYVKLGQLKPKCPSIVYQPPSQTAEEREQEIAKIVRENMPGGAQSLGAAPFDFMREFPAGPAATVTAAKSKFSPRFCFSYFGLTGDPFLRDTQKIYPDSYLSQLAARGVDGVWLQGVLYTLAPFPWDSTLSERREERLANLRGLIDRARKYGIGIYLYLNEPRAMPQQFYEAHPELKGVSEGEYAALCTSNAEVKKYIREAVASVCSEAPNLKGFFTITASENLTNCYSHFQGKNCPRCSARKPEEVVAEVVNLYKAGIADAGTATDLLVWDWGWPDEWPQNLIPLLPKDVALMSVSEWSMPITRGGIDNAVGEYSMSVIGPGPRATRNWGIARDHGMRAIAKVQVGATWELGSVPYIPVCYNVAEHMANLRAAGVDGLMLSWTLGGYPSPNLEIVAELGKSESDGSAGAVSPQDAVARVAERRFGPQLGPEVAKAWRVWSDGFKEFPYNSAVLYNAPQHVGPSNPLWSSPTGYRATMVGFPYDDLDGWRGNYPPDVLAAQFMKLADAFKSGLAQLAKATEKQSDQAYTRALQDEMRIAYACAIHYESAANQAKFLSLRAKSDSAEAKTELASLVRSEMRLAREMCEIQMADSRLGYEASNQYYYLTLDLVEKVLNCQDLLDRWLK